MSQTGSSRRINAGCQCDSYGNVTKALDQVKAPEDG